MSSVERRSTRAGTRIGQVLALLVVALVVGVLALAVVVPRLAGATPYTILTGSMSPGMPPGTLVVVRPVDPGDISTGTVITYQVRSGDPDVVTHRVVSQGMRPDGSTVFRTRGDANDVIDPGWVRPVQVKGERWYAVPHLGRVTNLLTSGQRHGAIVVVSAILLVYAAVMLVGSARDVRARRRAVDRHGG